MNIALGFLGGILFIEKVEKSKRNFTRQNRKQSESEQSKSTIADHAVQHNHVINWQYAKILAKECVSDVRYIKEAIWITRRAPNTMNRDEGAHYLSHVYDPLLATPTSGDRRNRRGDQVPSFWWSVLTRTHEIVNTSIFFCFCFDKRTLNYVYQQTWWISSRTKSSCP